MFLPSEPRNMPEKIGDMYQKPNVGILMHFNAISGHGNVVSVSILKRADITWDTQPRVSFSSTNTIRDTQPHLFNYETIRKYN